MSNKLLIHPDDVLALRLIYWPHVRLYDKQLEIVRSTFLNDETYVYAGNELGKDFVAGFIVATAFLCCWLKNVTARIVTTSVAEHHLKVLWGEIGRFLTTPARPLLASLGGPFVLNYQEIRLVDEAESKNPLSYAVGRVSAKGEGMAGHHAEFTLAVGDEASGIDDVVYEMTQGWARRMLWIGNPNDCANFYRRARREGELAA